MNVPLPKWKDKTLWGTLFVLGVVGDYLVMNVASRLSDTAGAGSVTTGLGVLGTVLFFIAAGAQIIHCLYQIDRVPACSLVLIALMFGWLAGLVGIWFFFVLVGFSLYSIIAVPCRALTILIRYMKRKIKSTGAI